MNFFTQEAEIAIIIPKINTLNKVKNVTFGIGIKIAPTDTADMFEPRFMKKSIT